MSFLSKLTKAVKNTAEKFIEKNIPEKFRGIATKASSFLVNRFENNRIVNIVDEKFTSWIDQGESDNHCEQEREKSFENFADIEDKSPLPQVFQEEEEEEEERPVRTETWEEEQKRLENSTDPQDAIYLKNKREWIARSDDLNKPQEVIPDLEAAIQLDIPDSTTMVRPYKEGYIIRVTFGDQRPETIDQLQNALDSVGEYLFYKYGKQKSNKLDAQVILQGNGKFLSASHLLPMFDAIGEARSFGVDNCLSIGGISGGGDSYESIEIEYLDYMEIQVF